MFSTSSLRMAFVAATLAATATVAVSQSGMKMDSMKTDMPGMSKMLPSERDSEATKAYKQSMMNMMRQMPEFTGDADTDFMRQMRVHHAAAIDMAETVQKFGKNGETKKLAGEIITAQKKEIGEIDRWLKQHAGK